MRLAQSLFVEKQTPHPGPTNNYKTSNQTKRYKFSNDFLDKAIREVKFWIIVVTLYLCDYRWLYYYYYYY